MHYHVFLVFKTIEVEKQSRSSLSKRCILWATVKHMLDLEGIMNCIFMLSFILVVGRYWRLLVNLMAALLGWTTKERKNPLHRKDFNSSVHGDSRDEQDWRCYKSKSRIWDGRNMFPRTLKRRCNIYYDLLNVITPMTKPYWSNPVTYIPDGSA